MSTKRSNRSTPALADTTGSAEEDKLQVTTKSNGVLLAQPTDRHENVTSEAPKASKANSDQVRCSL
jgi:hypothetical protein